QVSVVVGQFFSGMNIPDSNLKIVSCSYATTPEAMIDKTAIIPAEHKVAFVIPVRIRIENILVDGFHLVKLFFCNDLIEIVEYPGNCAGRNKLRCYNSITNFLTDVTKGGIRM